MTHIIRFPVPDFLKDFDARISSYAKQIERARPRTFPTEDRIYIIDYRLNILFASPDLTGDMTNFFFAYGQAGHNEQDFYCDSSAFTASPPGILHDKREMVDFLMDYCFLPIEELFSTVAVIFFEAELAKIKPLSQLQTVILMERYRPENLVNWETLPNEAERLRVYGPEQL